MVSGVDKNGMVDGVTPLIAAALTNQVQVAKYLIKDAKVDVNIKVGSVFLRVAL